jgi:hypothetical protein
VKIVRLGKLAQMGLFSLPQSILPTSDRVPCNLTKHFLSRVIHLFVRLT